MIGRRASLGLAGPPGLSSMFKAAGTAAASIGIDLADFSSIQNSSQDNQTADDRPISDINCLKTANSMF